MRIPPTWLSFISSLLLIHHGVAQLSPVEKALLKIRDETASNNTFLGTQELRLWQDRLEKADSRTPGGDMALAAQSLGIAQLRQGLEKQAVNTLGRAFQKARQSKVPAKQLGESLFFLGLAYLRYGETQNCCQQHSPDSCILPLKGGGLHSKPEGSRNAMTAFAKVLEILKPDDPRYHSARWLLNLSAMTVGAYPNSVPPEHRVLPERVTKSSQFPSFANVAPQSGLATFSLAGGAIVDDLNGDDYLDILVSTWDTSESLTLFLNRQDGTFRKVQKEAGLAHQLGGLNLVHADYNNDGHLDILVLRGAWLADNGRHPNSLLRNNGPNADGIPQFTDVTSEVGLNQNHYPTQTADWADYDLDGDLDLFIGNETTATIQAPCQLYRNDGGRFTDVSKAAGIANGRFTKGAVWGDLDGDRYPDLCLSNMDEPNRVYRNQQDGTFKDVTTTLGLDQPVRSFPLWVWDADNNGALDVFIPFFSPDAGLTGSYYFGFKIRDEHLSGHHLNIGKGEFKNSARRAGLILPTMPMGCNFGDLNNDGWLDFYLGTGNTGLSNITPNLMFLNREGKAFENVTLGGGFGHLQKGHSIAFADLDNDGDLDIFAQMGGAFPVDKYYDALFENPGFGNHWLSVKLVGKTSPRCAIGARLKATFVDDGKTRSVYRWVDSGSSFGSNPLRPWFGLGKATSVESLEIFWPTTGKTQRFENLKIDQTIRVHEGRADVEQILLKSTPLGR